MPEEIHSLLTIFKGWDGYQISLVRAIAPLSREQLAYFAFLRPRCNNKKTSSP
jgi:hypothetical protein